MKRPDSPEQVRELDWNELRKQVGSVDELSAQGSREELEEKYIGYLFDDEADAEPEEYDEAGENPHDTPSDEGEDPPEPGSEDQDQDDLVPDRAHAGSVLDLDGTVDRDEVADDGQDPQQDADEEVEEPDAEPEPQPEPAASSFQFGTAHARAVHKLFNKVVRTVVARVRGFRPRPIKDAEIREVQEPTLELMNRYAPDSMKQGPAGDTLLVMEIVEPHLRTVREAVQNRQEPEESSDGPEIEKVDDDAASANEQEQPDPEELDGLAGSGEDWASSR